MTPEEKQKKLLSHLGSLGNVAVAFSGGVDSTYLLWAAREALGERALALTVASDFVPRRELDRAETFCRERGIPLTVVPVDVLAVPGVADNPPDRCYLCKKALFTHLWEAARERGFSTLAEGSNADDDGDYRPGLRAVRELSAASPLREAELTKADIRAILRAVKDHPTAVVATTEKDCQRVLDLKDIPDELKVRMFQVPIEVGFLSLLECRVDDKVSVNSAYYNACSRTERRNIRDGDRWRCSDKRCCLR